MPEPLAELFSSRVRAAVLALVLPRPHLRFSLTDLSRRLGSAGEQPAARVLQADPARSLARRAGWECPPLLSRSGMAAAGAADGADGARHAARGGATRRGRRGAGHRRRLGQRRPRIPDRIRCTWWSWAVSGWRSWTGFSTAAGSPWFRSRAPVGSSSRISGQLTGRRGWPEAIPSLLRCVRATGSSFARSRGRSARIRTWPSRRGWHTACGSGMVSSAMSVVTWGGSRRGVVE